MDNQPAYPNKPDLELESINTDGVVSVGEINTRLMREAVVEPDYRESWVSGAKTAYEEISVWAQERIVRAGPYDDTRALQELVSILGDKIRDVHSRATTGDSNA